MVLTCTASSPANFYWHPLRLKLKFKSRNIHTSGCSAQSLGHLRHCLTPPILAPGFDANDHADIYANCDVNENRH